MLISYADLQAPSQHDVHEAQSGDVIYYRLSNTDSHAAVVTDVNPDPKSGGLRVIDSNYDDREHITQHPMDWQRLVKKPYHAVHLADLINYLNGAHHSAQYCDADFDVSLTTAHGCGSTFAPGEVPMAHVSSTVGVTIKLTVGTRDAGGARVIADGVTVVGGHPIDVPIPSDLKQFFSYNPNNWFRLKLSARRGTRTLEPLPCVFGLAPPDSPNVIYPPQGGGTTSNPGPCPTPVSHSVSFDDQPVGSASSSLTCGVEGAGTGCFGVVNPYTHPISVNTYVSGANAGDFAITSNGCSGSEAPGASCYVSVSFVPTALGRRTATLSVWADGCEQHRWQLAGNGVTGPTVVSGPSSGTE